MKMLNRLKKLFKSQPSPSLEQVRDFISVADVLEDNRREKEIVNLQVWIDKPIIILSNNYPFIDVGFGRDITFISQAQNPVLVYDSYSESPEGIETKISLASVVMFYDDFKLDALLKLTPWEIGHLFYGKYSHKTEQTIEELNDLRQKFHPKNKEEYLFWNGFGKDVQIHYAKG